MSEFADNCCALSDRTTILTVNDVLYNTLQHLQRGDCDALIASSVTALIHSWQASADVIGKLCSGDAERWQAAIRQIQAPVNLAEILRARPNPGLSCCRL
jgi:hypothetical protein